MIEKPQSKPIDAAYLPEKLCEVGQFCNWRWEWNEKNGYWTKIPYNPKTGRRGDSTDPAKFSNFDTAVSAERNHDGVGLGIFDQIAGIDVDHCLDDDGNLSDLGKDIVSTMNSYTEVSPSGDGVHILFTIPRSFDRTGLRERYKIKNGNIEVYISGFTAGRFLTLTGNAMDPARDLEERGEEVRAILEKYMIKGSSFEATDPTPEDDKILERALNSKNQKFKPLWEGNITGYKSQSEADLALCCELAFWTARDPLAIDRLFRRSGLYREKWERADYRKNTIWEALSFCNDVWTPRREHETAPTPSETVEGLIIDPEEPKKNTPGLYREQIARWSKDKEPALEYMRGLGISDIVSNIYGVCYNPEQKFYDKDNKTWIHAPAVCLSYDDEGTYYSARSLDGEYFYRPDSKEAGPEPLYLADQLARGVCFVVESQIDALSVIEAGAPAVAIGGAANSAKLVKAVKGRKDPLILFLDHDTEPNKQGVLVGPTEQRKLAERLDEAGIPYRKAVFDFDGYDEPAKDANDLLRSKPKRFAREVENNIAAASDPTGISAFLIDVMTEKYKPILTGIKSLDKLLKGGLIPQSLVLLGGEAGSGKTILAQMIIESMAATGQKCIYFNLEMSKEQLIARSIARRVYVKDNMHKLTATDVLQGYKWTDLQRDLIVDAAGAYQREIGDRLQFNPLTGDKGVDLDEILKYMDETGEQALNAGKPAPIVCVDYIHLLHGKPGEDIKDVLGRACYGLKNYAIKYNTIAIAIMATSRAANDRKGASLSAGRDSSNLEYSGDLILQLKHDTAEDKPGETHLCITKSRFTATNPAGIKYRIHGGQSYMEPVEDEQRTGGKGKARNSAANDDTFKPVPGSLFEDEVRELFG